MHLKSHDFMASSLMFQCAVLAYNTMRWMALPVVAKGYSIGRSRPSELFLIRTAGQLPCEAAINPR